jgi:hypothetical protein
MIPEIVYTFLSHFAVALGVGAALYSVSRVLTKHRAERHLLETINETIRGTQQRTELESLLEEIYANKGVDHKLVNIYKLVLSDALSKLNENEAAAIKEATDQPSIVGQRQYMQKLLEQTVRDNRRLEPRHTSGDDPPAPAL